MKKNIYLTLITLSILQVTSVAGLVMPDSEIDYIGSSISNAFVATEPYTLNIRDSIYSSNLWGKSRGFDFSGNVPFVNPKTGKADAQTLQAWDPVFANSFSPYLSGSYNLNSARITNAGFPGRVEKKSINGVLTTMIRYNAFDGLTEGHPRTQLVSYDIPPRTHVRWDFEVAFGNADGINDWEFTTTKASPVLFWQMKSSSQTNPPLSLIVDTDSNNSTMLMITVMQRVGTAPYPTPIGNIIHGIPRHKMVPIVIEAFLDERAIENRGKGVLQITVNNVVIVNQFGPNLVAGSSSHNFDMAVYIPSEKSTYSHTRATFWKTARMLVFPVNTTQSIVPMVNISSFNVNNITSTTALFNWTTNVPTTGVISFGKDTNLSDSRTDRTLTTSHSLTINGLSKNTDYYYKVTAYNQNVDDLVESPVISFITK
jgi:hypothetical protein